MTYINTTEHITLAHAAHRIISYITVTKETIKTTNAHKHTH